MPSFSVWYSAERPNYNTNIDLRFPYSETINYNADSDFHVEKIRFNNLIQHVDYWGEGKVVCGDGIRGFSDCYNVNHRFQLVSSGPDVDRKIPNRIPVTNDEDCDTSDFIKDNSVLTVTVVGVRITSSCAKDIARIVNNDRGKVVVYWVHGDSKEIAELTDELGKKGLIPSPNTALPVELQGLTYYDSHVTFLNSRIRKAMADELYNYVINDNYAIAVNKAHSYGVASGCEFINEIVTRLISAAPRKVMSFAFKLWYGGAREIVRNCFPKSFNHIFNQDAVTIVNEEYGKPLILDATNESRLWGDNKGELTSERVSWKVLSMWSSDGVKFKLFNIHRRMFCILNATADKSTDRRGLGTKLKTEHNCRYYLEPLIKDGILVFFIISCEYGQRLKMDVTTNNEGDRRIYGRTKNVYKEGEEVFRWVIAAF